MYEKKIILLTSSPSTYNIQIWQRNELSLTEGFSEWRNQGERQDIFPSQAGKQEPTQEMLCSQQGYWPPQVAASFAYTWGEAGAPHVWNDHDLSLGDWPCSRWCYTEPCKPESGEKGSTTQWGCCPGPARLLGTQAGLHLCLCLPICKTLGWQLCAVKQKDIEEMHHKCSAQCPVCHPVLLFYP